MTWTHNPGSPEAVANGCTCPVLDNGRGRLPADVVEHRGWVINAGCPLHDVRTPTRPG